MFKTAMTVPLMTFFAVSILSDLSMVRSIREVSDLPSDAYVANKKTDYTIPVQATALSTAIFLLYPVIPIGVRFLTHDRVRTK